VFKLGNSPITGLLRRRFTRLRVPVSPPLHRLGDERWELGEAERFAQGLGRGGLHAPVAKLRAVGARACGSVRRIARRLWSLGETMGAPAPGHGRRSSPQSQGDLFVVVAFLALAAT
jgi:hypothetical protein